MYSEEELSTAVLNERERLMLLAVHLESNGELSADMLASMAEIVISSKNVETKREDNNNKIIHTMTHEITGCNSGTAKYAINSIMEIHRQSSEAFKDAVAVALKQIEEDN